MRTLIFSILALATLSGGASAVFAQTTYYLDMHVGYNYVDDGDLTVPPDASASYDPSPAFGASLGYLDASGFRIEGELTHRSNDVEKIGGAAAKGHFTMTSLMVNALYELQFGGGGIYGGGSPLRPYIGVGGGAARVGLEEVTFDLATTTYDDFDYVLAYQFIGGVGMEVTENVFVTFDYRYIIADNVDIEDTGGTAYEIDTVQSTFMVGLRTSF